jgi:hypothetical protein
VWLATRAASHHRPPTGTNFVHKFCTVNSFGSVVRSAPEEEEVVEEDGPLQRQRDDALARHGPVVLLYRESRRELVDRSPRTTRRRSGGLDAGMPSNAGRAGQTSGSRRRGGAGQRPHSCRFPRSQCPNSASPSSRTCRRCNLLRFVHEKLDSTQASVPTPPIPHVRRDGCDSVFVSHIKDLLRRGFEARDPIPPSGRESYPPPRQRESRIDRAGAFCLWRATIEKGGLYASDSEPRDTVD